MSDYIDEYLELIARDLRGPAIESHRTLLETEDHLRSSAADLMEIGMTDEDAQREAISRFGKAREVADGHNAEAGIFTFGATVRSLFAAVYELLSVGLVVVGISAAVAYVVSLLTSKEAVFGLPAIALPSMQNCSYWMQIHPTAGNCQIAGTWEAANDSTWMLGALGVIGLALLLVRRIFNRSFLFSLNAVPPMLVPAVATVMFALASAGLFIVGHGNGVIQNAWGQGRWYSESGTAFAAALVSAFFLLRTIREPLRQN